MEPIPRWVQGLETFDGMFEIGLPTLYLSDAFILIGVGYLFFRRMVVPRLRYLSFVSDHFALLLLIAIAGSGIWMRYVSPVDLEQVKTLVLGWVTFSPVPATGLGAVFCVHLFLVCVLLAWFPFSKLMHMAGVFLSPTRNLANNNRAQRHVNPWNAPSRCTRTKNTKQNSASRCVKREYPSNHRGKMNPHHRSMEISMASIIMPPPEELIKIRYKMPETDWMDTPTVFRPGTWSYAAAPKNLSYLGLPNPRVWQPTDEDWKLPENWKEIILEGMRERLEKYRSFRLFMDICVRCGACADKCHFYMGTGDPKNMPVLRAELIRSVYRRYFTTAGKLGRLAGARELTPEVIKEWFYYFYQCTECRRCSVFCPYGIDQAEITMIGRELLNLVGCNINWAVEPAANCYRTGNHLGIQPAGIKDILDFLADDIEERTGIRVDVPINKKGADILFVTPSGDYFADPGTYTCMGYLMLFHEIGLNYTFSTYASEGGNFGLFISHEMVKRLNAKIYAEAKRLGVKWILGGECGHMWRVIHQYMDTMNGPADFLEAPVSPITGTRFDNARATKMVHIAEFTADLIRHGKLKLDPTRNDHLRLTFHDSCNPARAMGLFEEPRYIIRHTCRNFFEMPEDTIREKTLCCGGGAGLGNDENIEMRMRGGMPRAMAVRHVREKHGVNRLACMCAIDRATLTALMDYWVPGVTVMGVHELLANALVMKGEKARDTDLRGDPLAEKEMSDRAKIMTGLIVVWSW